MSRYVARPRRKRDQARRLIEELIREQQLWGQRLLDYRQLAAELGLSQWTVQQALADLEADRILERRQGAGTFVAEAPPSAGAKRTCTLALVATRWSPDVPGWNYSAEMIRGALRQAARKRAACQVLSLDRQEDRDRLESLRELRRFDGFIVMGLEPPLLDRDLLSRLVALDGRPVVLLDDTVRDLPVTCVVDGSFEGMRAVTRHVLRLGHRRVGLLDCHNRDAINPEKHAGYLAALKERGVEPDPDLVTVPPRRPHSDPSEGTEFSALVEADVGRLLALAEPPTAIVAFDDNFALPAMRELERRGLRVGRDVCLAGHGDGAIRRGLCDRLTSCRTYPRKMGEAAARAALEPGHRGEARTIIVPNRLYVRASTCPPAASPE